MCNSTPSWGGGEKWCLDTARELRRLGHTVSMVVLPDSALAERAQEEGFAAHELNVTGRSWLNPMFLRKAARMLESDGVDTIILNGSRDVKAFGIASWMAAIHTRVYRRHIPVPIRSNAVNRFLCTRVLTRVIANSNATRDATLSRLEGVLDPGIVDVVPNGIDVDAFDRATAAQVRPRADDCVVLGHVGRLTAEKGQRELLEGARLLVESGVHFRLLIAGDGELRSELSASVQELGLASHVEFLGFVENVSAFMKSIDVFLFPSRWEGFGYAVIEAAAAGVPTVAFDVFAMPEVIEDGKTGLLGPAGDVAGYAACVARLAREAARRQEMGSAARRRVEVHYRLDRVTRQLEESMWGAA